MRTRKSRARILATCCGMAAFTALVIGGLQPATARADKLLVTGGDSVTISTADTVTDGADVGIDSTWTSLPSGQNPSGSVVLDPDIAWTNYGNLNIASTFSLYSWVSGQASLNLSAGSTLYNNGTTRIGDNNWVPGPTGTLDVADGATFYSHGQLYVGEKGTLTIEGTVNNDTTQWSTIYGSANGGGSATVQGANAVWNSTVQVSNGFGDANLKILGGGTVNGDWGFVGTGTSNAMVHAVVQGDAQAGLISSWNVNDYISVGEYGAHGTLTVNDQGQVNGRRMFIGMDGTGTGAVIVNQGGNVQLTPTWQPASVTMWAGSSLDVSNGGRVLIGNGNITAVTAGTVQVGPSGTLAGEGDVYGNVVVAGGTISPGHSPGTITIHGDLNFTSGGGLTMQIAGTGAGDYDVINVLGAADFANGALTLEFLNGYAPTNGVPINLSFFSATGGLTGTFSSVNVTGLPGDTTAQVNLDQLASGEVSVVTSANVPEPASLALLGLGAVALLAKRRG